MWVSVEHLDNFLGVGFRLVGGSWSGASKSGEAPALNGNDASARS